VAQEFYLFCFFCLGFIVFRSEILRNFCRGSKKTFPSVKVTGGFHPLRRLHDDFSNRRYEQVLDSWPHLEKYTAEGLSLVVNALLALGRPEDIGFFIAKAVANLPQLKPNLYKVMMAVTSPACEVRRHHISVALRDIYEQARQCLDAAAVKELLLSLASHNDESRVASLLALLADQKCPAAPEFLSKVVQSFLACKNLDAALGYLQHLLAAPAIHSVPSELILQVVKMSAEAAISDDSAASGARPRAWDALEALRGAGFTDEVAFIFLEWAARQTPVDVAMAAQIESRLRNAGPMPLSAYDALVRINSSSAGDQAKAFACFNELVQAKHGAEPSEASLVGMISSCIEAHNGSLAEHIFHWARKQGRCTLPIFSATLKVLAAAKQAERICTIYESVAGDTELVLDETLNGQIINFAVQAGRLELARGLANRLKQPNAQSYMSLMRACGQEGKVEQALQLLRELQQSGDVDTVTYNCALDVCASCGNHTLAKRVLKEMKSAGRVDAVSYNIMLKFCMANGASPRAAEEVLREMRQRGLQPNTATYNSLIGGALGAGDFGKAWRIIDQMESAGLKVDAFTLSILFKGYKNERRAMDTECIDRALALVRKHSVKVDEVLVNVALEACFALRDMNRLKNAMAIFHTSGWTLSKEASMHTYGVLIKAHGLGQNLKEAWRLWHEVTAEKGLAASEQLYSQMLDVLVTNDCLEDALRLFKDMKQAHSNLDSSGFAVAYAMIIRGFAQRKNCTQALRCYEEMKANGTKVSLVVLNTLIDACSRVGDMDAASRLFQDMLKTDVVPDLITYSTLIKGYCVCNELDQALQLFTVMQKKGIRPDAIVFNSLLDGCAKKQMTSLCEQVIRDMEKAGVVPSNHSASILIKLYGRCKDLDAAFKVVDEMPQKYGFKPNNPVYTCLMSACISNGRLDRAMELRVRMMKENIYPDEKTYSTLLRGTLRVASVEQCVLLLKAALDQKDGRNCTARNLLDEELVRSVLLLVRRRNLWEAHGRELVDRMRSSGMSVRVPGEGAKAGARGSTQDGPKLANSSSARGTMQGPRAGASSTQDGHRVGRRPVGAGQQRDKISNRTFGNGAKHDMDAKVLQQFCGETASVLIK
jgi:pentatricopeptide repeat protein